MGLPAARVADNVVHPLPPVLTGSPGSLNVFIGGKPAWRGIPIAQAGVIQAAKQVADGIIQAAEAATVAAAGTPAAPAAKAAEEATKASLAVTMGTMIQSMAAAASAQAAFSGGMVDIHMCTTPLPIPPHGPGVVVDGSTAVMINGLPACFVTGTIVEAVGPPNKIVNGCPTVMIGKGPVPPSVPIDTSAMARQMQAQADQAAAQASAAEQARQQQQQQS
jgi:uncharacterized Zn-binding protein involved in type VI secretion